jgi:hypothetical protein
MVPEDMVMIRSINPGYRNRELLKWRGMLLISLVFEVVQPSLAVALDFKNDCREVVDTFVSARDEIRSGEPMASVRERVTQMLNTAAIKSGVGETISARTGYQLQSRTTEAGNKIDERLANRMRSQASGFAKQQIVEEKTLRENGREFLVIDSQAQVCVPKSPALVKEVVRIGQTINIQQNNLPEFHDLLVNVFSTSIAFAVSQPDNPFADYEVRGKLDRINLVELPVPDGEVVGAKRTRISVSVTVEAHGIDTEEIISSTVSDFKIFTRAGDPETQASDVARAIMRKAADELHNKLLLTRSQGAPAAVEKGLVNKRVNW